MRGRQTASLPENALAVSDGQHEEVSARLPSSSTILSRSSSREGIGRRASSVVASVSVLPYPLPRGISSCCAPSRRLKTHSKRFTLRKKGRGYRRGAGRIITGRFKGRTPRRYRSGPGPQDAASELSNARTRSKDGTHRLEVAQRLLLGHELLPLFADFALDFELDLAELFPRVRFCRPMSNRRTFSSSRRSCSSLRRTD
jgi:hypothetical protein